MKKTNYLKQNSSRKLSKNHVKVSSLLGLFVFLFVQTYGQWTTIGFTADDHFTVPSNVYVVKAEAWGGGGAGGYVETSFKFLPSAGGGGGAYAMTQFIVTPGSTMTITVGKAGTNTSVPVNGGNSIVKYNGDTKLLAVGGATAASRFNSSDPQNGGQGGQSVNCIGMVKYSGGNGANAYDGTSGAFCYSGGGGGAAYSNKNGNNANENKGGNAIEGNGKGGDGVRSAPLGPWWGSGQAGSSHGGGGGGSIASATNEYHGCNGGVGYVRLSYYTFNPGSISNGEYTICSCESPNEITGTAAQGDSPVYQWYVSVNGAEAVAISAATDKNYTPADYTSTPGIYVFTRKAKNEVVTDFVACEGSVTLEVTDALELIGIWPNDIIISPSESLDASLLATNKDIQTLFPCASVSSNDVISKDNCGNLITRTFEIKDGCDQVVTKTQILRQGESNAPTFTCPADIDVHRIVPNANYNIDPSVTGNPTNLYDDVTPAEELTVSYEDVVVGTETPNTVTVVKRTWTVTDWCNNTTTATQLISIMPALLEFNTTLSCPDDIEAILYYSACDTALNLGTATYQTNTEGLTITLTNNAEIARYPVGIHTITWTITDQYGFSLYCDQTVIVKYPECMTVATDVESNTYNVVRVGCDCWLASNLKSTKYSDGSDVAQVFDYEENAANVDKYGKLYTWYSANNVAEDDNTAVPTTAIAPDGHAYVQGVCPQGWALPTVANYQNLFNSVGNTNVLKDDDVQYWLPNAAGINSNTGFDARGAGYYDSSIDRYINLLGQTYFWTSDVVTNVWAGMCFSVTHSCPTGLILEELRGRGQSVRCVRVI